MMGFCGKRAGGAFALAGHPCRPEYDEYFWPGIYAEPHSATMHVLEQAKSLQDILDHIPDTVTEKPDILP